jgi:signal transduction histidine kinase
MQDGTYVAFASLDGILLSTEDAFSTSSSVAAVALFLLFLLSRKLSKVVIKPAENAWSDQKRFIADASHDLKTPLTVIMANNDILLAHPEKTVAEQQKWLESTRQETEYMSSLINKMLELAKTDSLLEKIQLDNVNISEVVEKAVLQLEPVAFESGVIIQADITRDIVSRSNSTELYKLTQILIDNAVKYAPCNSTVMVSLARSKKEIIFSVNNKGDIIPSEQLEHIFDRFYRTDDARTKGGFGLGLSIAKNVANALGGEIFATSDDNGTTFTVKFKE